MARKAELGGGLVGLIFLTLAAWEWISGDSWVVWAILGFLFGGFGALSRLFGGKGNG
ncbi:hypothetical protein SOQ14_11255 [Erythrobacter sp. T5W1-R]|uniref:hypothetical protein n=1 Tax=Erythrobacter sp. T5W1-R TaxID=3101752 RepID=UPI002AFF7F8D|nr:hypothetical protein [Erythrobacter sp. T5W1-R]MEA1619494.1 hypothetical protein [Erythrobacter sp. T5W1-R]